jgi:hypothetical protein
MKVICIESNRSSEPNIISRVQTLREDTSKICFPQRLLLGNLYFMDHYHVKQAFSSTASPYFGRTDVRPLGNVMAVSLIPEL